MRELHTREKITTRDLTCMQSCVYVNISRKGGGVHNLHQILKEGQVRDSKKG